ncbi:hypothetical protein LCGC14_3083030 [marine sediment metagenome]|uniref:Uncharacterized protein n=1 Tax=marine sediment metagenome TaxID=412755 RepID=A0A0F8X1B0_9ZZZZ
MKRLTLLLLLAVVGCGVARFRQQSIDIAGSLRDQSTALMAQATEPFSDHSDSVAALRARLSAQLVIEDAREDNSESATQWRLLTDPRGALLGGFLSRWEAQGTLGQFFIDAARTQVVAAFRIIIETERAKR